MSLQRNFRVGGVLTTGVVLLFALAPFGMCQNALVQEVEPETSDTIEEIVVHGNKSITQLRLELYRAQEVAFDLFNSLNSDDDYDIHCYKEAPIGSHIMRRVCKPNYVKKLTAAATSRWLLGGQSQTYLHPTARIRRKDKLLREEMEALVIERPELLKVLSEFSDANLALESERKRRCEDQIAECLQ